MPIGKCHKNENFLNCCELMKLYTFYSRTYYKLINFDFNNFIQLTHLSDLTDLLDLLQHYAEAIFCKEAAF